LGKVLAFDAEILFVFIADNKQITQFFALSNHSPAQADYDYSKGLTSSQPFTIPAGAWVLVSVPFAGMTLFGHWFSNFGLFGPFRTCFHSNSFRGTDVATNIGRVLNPANVRFCVMKNL
jgi:hypothetical protein